MEKQLDKKLTGAIFGFKQGTKTAKEVNAAMADEWNKKFVEAAKERSKNKE